MPPAKAHDAPAPSSRPNAVKARELGESELERDRKEFRGALKATKRAIAAGIAKIRKSS